MEEIFSGASTDGVFAWDASDEEFDIWRKTLPPALNSLQNVQAGQGAWVMSQAEDQVTQDPIEGPLDVSLVAGLNLVGWTGSDTPASEVAEILGADFLIGWNGSDQEFERFDVALPAAYNSVTTVQEGAGLWANRSSAGTVTLPPPNGGGEPEPGLESGEFRTTARDGVEIVGDVFVGSSTWVLFAHQNGQDRSAWGQYPAIFNDMGFTTATWDFRSFGDS